jgi:hypothetical protein
MSALGSEELAALLGEISHDDEGNRKLQLLIVQHLATATREQVNSSQAMTQQMGHLAREVHKLAVVTARLEERAEPLQALASDHEARLRKLEQVSDDPVATAHEERIRKLELADSQMKAKGKFFEWIVGNWTSLAALGAAIYAVFRKDFQ